MPSACFRAAVSKFVNCGMLPVWGCRIPSCASSVCLLLLPVFGGDTLGAWPFGGASPVYSSECRGHRRCNPDAKASVPARKAAPGRTYPRYFGAKLVFFYTVHKSWVEKMPHTGGKCPRKCCEIVQKCGRIFRKCGKKIAFPRTFHHRCARHPGRRAVLKPRSKRGTGLQWLLSGKVLMGCPRALRGVWGLGARKKPGGCTAKRVFAVQPPGILSHLPVVR